MQHIVPQVTDEFGSKISDENRIRNIQQALCASRSSGVTNKEVEIEQTVLEMTMQDRRGLMSEITVVLDQLGFNVSAAVAWTHYTRAACILSVEEGSKGGPVTDLTGLAQVQNYLESVVGASNVRFTALAAGRTQKERRLHQLLYADRDYELCNGCDSATHVSIETCKEKDYLVVNVRCKYRPKLLFDTVCVLTDMQYVVFHAAVSSKGSIANQVSLIMSMPECGYQEMMKREMMIHKAEGRMQ